MPSLLCSHILTLALRCAPTLVHFPCALRTYRLSWIVTFPDPRRSFALAVLLLLLLWLLWLYRNVMPEVRGGLGANNEVEIPYGILVRTLGTLPSRIDNINLTVTLGRGPVCLHKSSTRSYIVSCPVGVMRWVEYHAEFSKRDARTEVELSRTVAAQT